MTTKMRRMQQRRDSAANWTAANPVLSSGEIGYETDTGLMKIGNGATAWSGLSYLGNALHVGVRATGVGQSIPNSTWTSVALNGEDFDSHGFHDPVTNNSRITIPAGKGGKYLITGSLMWNSNATGARAARILKNGATVLDDTYEDKDGPNSAIVESVVATVAALAAGDYIELQGFQGSGALLGIDGSANYPLAFTATLLGT